MGERVSQLNEKRADGNDVHVMKSTNDTWTKSLMQRQIFIHENQTGTWASTEPTGNGDNTYKKYPQNEKRLREMRVSDDYMSGTQNGFTFSPHIIVPHSPSPFSLTCGVIYTS